METIPTIKRALRIREAYREAYYRDKSLNRNQFQWVIHSSF